MGQNHLQMIIMLSWIFFTTRVTQLTYCF